VEKSSCSVAGLDEGILLIVVKIKETQHIHIYKLVNVVRGQLNVMCRRLLSQREQESLMRRLGAMLLSY